jgi:hypothetical protein
MFKHLLLLSLVMAFLSCADPAKWRTPQRLDAIEAKGKYDSMMTDLEKPVDTIIRIDSAQH